MSEAGPIAAGGEPESSMESGAASAAPERVCPNCGAALLDSRCKLVCPDRTCGYFMSCSDFY